VVPALYEQLLFLRRVADSVLWRRVAQNCIEYLLVF